MKRSQIIARRRLLTQEWRRAKQHLKDCTKELKETEEKLKTATQFVELADNFDMRRIMSDDALDILSKTATWIVTHHEQKNVHLVHFYDLIKDVEKPKQLVLDNILARSPLIGDDGLEVHVQPGELVAVTAKKVSKGLLTHIANVGPSTPEGQIQWEYAKSKLGLVPEPIIQNKEHIMQLDGQFRKLISDMKKGNDVNN